MSGAGRSLEGAFSEPVPQQRCQSGEALVEWRSSDQVENGTPSTSPPYWDIDDDDDGGPKPSELYGKHTWKIDKFSQINKRELRSNAFEVGGYKWYILIYPQGCDVCNHLSLFLCVANHEKLLPGWSHFAQFTIAVVNKDPKKSKYSDTLHRFWKKEHDWGWKKFMELSKVMDGFIDADTLIIKAQVQVIRERADRPFRCLDCQYRRELVRVYLTSVEQSCRRFMEERRGKLGKLIEDKARWSSFRGFWLSMDQNSRRRMSREKCETILKVVVKHFFQEKEVTSTLVMDSLYSGLKALEGQYKGKRSKGNSLEAGDFSVPIVRMEKDMFMLVDDVLPLLERVAVEPLPPKDEKGPQNRTKDGALGEEFNKDSIERDERRLTELGRRTIEIFILAHVFSKIDVAYQEAVALIKQEELIREEEEAGLAEMEQRARRGAADKEKKSKKKGKQKRNNRKPKDKGRDEKSRNIAQDKAEQDICNVPMKESLAAEPEMVTEKSDPVEDVSDMSDSIECVPEILPRDSEDRDVSPVSWDTDNSEVHPPTEASSSGVSGLSSVQNGTEGRSSSVVDDSSSNCSSDSLPSVAISVPQIGNSHNQKNIKSPSRGMNHVNKLTSDRADWDSEKPDNPSKAVPDSGNQVDASSPGFEAIESRVRIVNGAERNVTKEEETDSLHGKHGAKDVDVEVSADKAPCVPRSPSKKTPSTAPSKIAVSDPIVKKSASASPRKADKSAIPPPSAENASRSISDTPTPAPPDPPEKPATNPVHGSETSSTPAMSRPLSAPLFPTPTPPVSVVPTVQVGPTLARSVSAVGRLVPEPTSASQSYAPLSYRNAIMGPTLSEGSPVYTPNSAIPAVNASYSYSQAPPLVSTPLFSPYANGRVESHQIKPSFSFGMVTHRDTFPNGTHWETSRNLPDNGVQNFDPFGSMPAGISGRHTHGLQDEFPHLDIINDLLDDEFNPVAPNLGDVGFGYGPQYLNRHYSFPGDPSVGSSCRFERTRSYQDDGLLHNYDMVRDSTPYGPYANGPIDGLVPNQWGMGGSEMAFHMRNSENDGYPYHIPEYQNLTVGVNGYTIFRPSNGL